MGNIKFDRSGAAQFVSETDIESIKPRILAANTELIERTGKGSEYTGWLDLPISYDKEEFIRIKEAAAAIKEDSEILVVIGIGGSYLGAKAAIEALTNIFHFKPEAPKVFFAGNNISSAYLSDIINAIGDRDFSLNVISKSGTTTEPSMAFRVFREVMEKRYGKEGAAKRIYATTDREKGALKILADEEGYTTFVVPDDIGGRYSVLTAVGLLPIAVAGCDIDALMQGAIDERTDILSEPFEKNDALQYAAFRNVAYDRGKSIELLANFEPSLRYTAEWWKQLFGESEGKDKKGLFPAAANFSTDLHSFGQYIQDGQRLFIETVLWVEKAKAEVMINYEERDLDGLNYMAGKTFQYVNEQAMKGTVLAHTEGGVPVSTLTIGELNEYYLGSLFYFFEYACGVSGYALGVNPFDQPGVENYKRNMFELLGKPGY